MLYIGKSHNINAYCFERITEVKIQRFNLALSSNVAELQYQDPLVSSFCDSLNKRKIYEKAEIRDAF